MATVNYFPSELMAVVLARDLQNGEVGRVGFSGGVPIAACLLAQALHAPDLTVVTPAGVNPRPGSLAWSPADHRYLEAAEAFDSFFDLYYQSERGLDFMFFTGAQIDRRGNFNLHGVRGPDGSLVFHGPGLANDAIAVTARRYYLYTFSHQPRTFVPRVDFVSGIGRAPRPAGRLGPKFCITPLAVLGFDDEGHMCLCSRHPGVNLDQVRDATGFPMSTPDPAAVTEPPTREELSLLREIDRDGVLRR